MGISIVAIVIIRVDIDANHRRPLSEDNNVLFRDDSMRIDFSRNHKNKRYAAVKVPGRSAPREPDAAIGWTDTAHALEGVLPRKEVIQPHLPVRLPCYDFTPLTLHTFDASAPRGFGRRLRVQTTRVV